MGIKHRVNEQFFDTWSNEMAYVLGYMYADGNIMHSPSIRAKYVRFCSTDKDRVELIRALMQSEHSFDIKEKSATRKKAYSFQIGSHKLFDALIAHGVTPRKSLTILFPEIPTKHLAAFVLGYFDGDGCSFIERNKNGDARKLHAIFTSGSKRFLETLHDRLVDVTGILGNGLYKHSSSRSAFQLRYATRDSMRLFMFMYGSEDLIGLALQRKYAIFTKYFDERGLGPLDLPYVVGKKGPVANQERIGLQTRHERVRLPPGPQSSKGGT